MIRPDIKKHLLKVQKPGRYTGGELNSVIKNKDDVNIRFAFCFPDSYEIGMSHLGMKILYSLYNDVPDVWCERVFAPWTDMEAVMREHSIPLYGLESGDPISDFDFIGFTMQYEMSYSNVLNMLELGGVELLADRRANDAPIIVCGGPCVCNPEPLADFVDIFSLGEGEEVSIEMFDLYRRCKEEGFDRNKFLRMAADIPGLYVPSLYDVTYGEDGTIAAFTPRDGAPATIRKRIVQDFDKAYKLDRIVVPQIEIVHDRVVGEIFRGCIRGCRFCQAGYIYRPVRERKPDTINEMCRDMCMNTGYDEISLSSLSSSDYTQLSPLLDKLLSWTEDNKVSISLPSLRVDGFSSELTEKLRKVRKGGLTFAPEAGTQRLRDVINKNVTEKELYNTCRTAFMGGWNSVKLYFMLGLPTETDEDVQGIAKLAQMVVDTYYENPDRPKGKAVSVSASASTFVPKPFTPFQWEPQITIDEIHRRQKVLQTSVTSRKISLSWHDANTSFLEAVFARGDRRLGAVLLRAHELGCRFDSWEEFFDLDVWRKAFADCGIDPEFYSCRARSYDEILPWDHIDFGVTKEFLIREREKSLRAETTPHCREKCSACGAADLTGGKCSVLN
ncbi:MAG: TIGR03960 family B12-binding radical SAM protein [Ruminococcaceae bacterium]|nr:TIGR03960 family B12-binding radical SAM protein [Oscillospiraceae bacterium]